MSPAHMAGARSGVLVTRQQTDSGHRAARGCRRVIGAPCREMTSLRRAARRRAQRCAIDDRVALLQHEQNLCRCAACPGDQHACFAVEQRDVPGMARVWMLQLPPTQVERVTIGGSPVARSRDERPSRVKPSVTIRLNLIRAEVRRVEIRLLTDAGMTRLDGSAPAESVAGADGPSGRASERW